MATRNMLFVIRSLLALGFITGTSTVATSSQCCDKDYESW
jgi:hypothetical protein